MAVISREQFQQVAAEHLAALDQVYLITAVSDGQGGGQVGRAAHVGVAMACGTALNSQLAVSINEIAPADSMRGAALDGEAVEDVVADLAATEGLPLHKRKIAMLYDNNLGGDVEYAKDLLREIAGRYDADQDGWLDSAEQQKLSLEDRTRMQQAGLITSRV